MPLYEFKHIETGEITEHSMKISELDAFKEAHPELRQYIGGAPSLGDPVRLGLKKNDDGFKEVLQKIAEKTPGGQGLKDHIR